MEPGAAGHRGLPHVYRKQGTLTPTPPGEGQPGMTHPHFTGQEEAQSGSARGLTKLNLFAPVSKGSKSHSWRMKQRPAKESASGPPIISTSLFITRQGPAYTAAHPASNPSRKGPL